MHTSEYIDSHTHLQRAETSMRHRHTDTDTEDAHAQRQSHTRGGTGTSMKICKAEAHLSVDVPQVHNRGRDMPFSLGILY